MMTDHLDNRKRPPAARVFVALAIPAEVMEQIQTFQQALRQRLRDNAFRWVDPFQMHLTVRFLGNVVREELPRVEQALRQAVQGIGPFELRAADLGFFPNRHRPRVCWVGIEGDTATLQALQEAVVRLTEPWVPREKKDFAPHLTLARIKEPSRLLGQNLAGLPDTMWRCEMGVWPVRQLDLMQSELLPQGARYTRLAAMPLVGD